MPVTVKFSREFYDKFGHKAVDELVNYLNQIDAGYRSELGELNARNFERFDDRLERRLAHMETRLAQMETRLIRWMFVFVATAVLAILGLG